MLFRSGSGSFSGHVAIRVEIVLRVVNGYYFLGSTVNCTTLGSGINHGHLVLVRHLVGLVGDLRTDGILGVDQLDGDVCGPHLAGDGIASHIPIRIVRLFRSVKHIVDVFPVNHPRYGFIRSMVGCWIIRIANCNLPSVALVEGNRRRRSKGFSCSVLVVRFHRQGVPARYINDDGGIFTLRLSVFRGGHVGEGRARVRILDRVLGIEGSRIVCRAVLAQRNGAHYFVCPGLVRIQIQRNSRPILGQGIGHVDVFQLHVAGVFYHNLVDDGVAHLGLLVSDSLTVHADHFFGDREAGIGNKIGL